MKKKIIFGVAICGVLLLGACAKKTASVDKMTIPVESDTSATVDSDLSANGGTTESSSAEITLEKGPGSDEKASSTAPVAVKAALWNTDMAAKLKTYMATFSSTMNQQYERYTPDASVSFYGLMAPSKILNGGEGFVVGDVGVPASSIIWSTDGFSSANYSLVDCYSDSDTAPYPTSHLYFFVFHGEQAQVLISMQNQGMPDNALHFHETENLDLKNNFAKIVADGRQANEAAARAQAKASARPAPDAKATVKFLIKHDPNTDISYSDWGIGQDSRGNYRKVKASSKQIQKEGGTGTLGFLHVYSNGDVVEASPTD